MSYLPSTPIKFCKMKAVSSATGFGLHLFNHEDTQDAEFCTKGSARYNNTKLKGLYFANWFFNTGGSTADWQFTCKYNTIDNTTAFGSGTSFHGSPNYPINLFMGSMFQWYTGLSQPPYWNGSVQSVVGQPLFRINYSATRNSVGAARSTSSHLSSHIFLLPIAENK